MKLLDGLGARGDVVDNLGMRLRLWALGKERWQLEVAVVASCQTWNTSGPLQLSSSSGVGQSSAYLRYWLTRYEVSIAAVLLRGGLGQYRSPLELEGHRPIWLFISWEAAARYICLLCQLMDIEALAVFYRSRFLGNIEAALVMATFCPGLSSKVDQ